MQDHIHEILCNGDEAFFEYVEKWLAWGLQNPHLQAEVALGFRGKKVSGKGVLGNTLVGMYGRRHSMHLTSATQLAGRFNGHYEACVYSLRTRRSGPATRPQSSSSSAWLPTRPMHRRRSSKARSWRRTASSS